MDIKFHWNNAQAAVHLFVTCYKNSDTEKLENFNVVIIFYCMTYEMVAI